MTRRCAVTRTYITPVPLVMACVDWLQAYRDLLANRIRWVYHATLYTGKPAFGGEAGQANKQTGYPFRNLPSAPAKAEEEVDLSACVAGRHGWRLVLVWPCGSLSLSHTHTHTCLFFLVDICADCDGLCVLMRLCFVFVVCFGCCVLLRVCVAALFDCVFLSSVRFFCLFRVLCLSVPAGTAKGRTNNPACSGPAPRHS